VLDFGRHYTPIPISALSHISLVTRLQPLEARDQVALRCRREAERIGHRRRPWPYRSLKPACQEEDEQDQEHDADDSAQSITPIPCCAARQESRYEAISRVVPSRCITTHRLESRDVTPVRTRAHGAAAYRRNLEPRILFASDLWQWGGNMNFIIWLLIGGLLGWGASLLTRSNGRPATILNVVVGIVGIMFGGFLLSGFLESSPFSPGEFSVAGLLVSSLGAMVPLAAIQLLGGNTRGQARTAPKRDVIAYSRFLYRNPLSK